MDRGVKAELQIADQLLLVLADGEHGYVIFGDDKTGGNDGLDREIDGDGCITRGGGLIGTLGGRL
jgi:hypothetical protein